MRFGVIRSYDNFMYKRKVNSYHPREMNIKVKFTLSNSSVN